MTPEDLWNVFTHIFLPASAFILLISLAVFLIGRYLGRVTEIEFAPILISFAIVGGAVGIAVGASRDSVVGGVFPAILTVFTVLLGYMFTNESIKEYRVMIPYCLIALMITSLFGMFSGSSIRGKHEKFQREYEKRILYYKEVELPLEKQRLENSAKNKTEKK